MSSIFSFASGCCDEVYDWHKLTEDVRGPLFFFSAFSRSSSSMFSRSMSVISVLHLLWSSCGYITVLGQFWMDEYDMIARDVAHKSHHGSAGLEEPVKAELGRVAYALAQLIINALLVKAQLVQHADEKSILLLGVVLAFVGAVRDPELMERRLITANLKSKTKHYAFQCNSSIVY